MTSREFLQIIAETIEYKCTGYDQRDKAMFRTAATYALIALRDLPPEISDAIGTRFQSPLQSSTSVAHDARVYWRALIDEILRN